MFVNTPEHFERKTRFFATYNSAKLTGVDNGVILENLRRLAAAGAKTWIRCPLAPWLNDFDEDLSAMRDFTSRLCSMEKLEICPCHLVGLEKYAKFGKTILYDSRLPASAHYADIRLYVFALSRDHESGSAMSRQMATWRCRVRDTPRLRRASRPRHRQPCGFHHIADHERRLRGTRMFTNRLGLSIP